MCKTGIHVSLQLTPSVYPLSKLSAWLAILAVSLFTSHSLSSLLQVLFTLHLLLLEWQMASVLSHPKYTFQLFTFLDFSATYDTNIQLPVEVHFFSRLPTPPTFSLLTTPPTPYALAYLPSGPCTTISRVCGFPHSVPATWYAFLLL